MSHTIDQQSAALVAHALLALFRPRLHAGLSQRALMVAARYGSCRAHASADRLDTRVGYLKHGRRVTVIDRGAPPNASRQQMHDFQRLLREMVARMSAEGLPPANIASELRLLAERLES